MSETPMQKQYQEIKARHKTELLLFRLGDFYELFGDDAHEASKILNIVLTARGKGTENEMPMCGIPFHALDNYLLKLLKAGKRVAICDQLSDPALPGIVKRDVTRVITPGTTLDNNVLTDKKNNYLASLVIIKDIWGLAITDLTTGEFSLTEISDFNLLKNEIFRLNISEAIVSSALFNDMRYREFVSALPNVTVHQLNVFDKAYDILTHHFKMNNLASFGIDNLKVGIEAGGALFNYLQTTQKAGLAHITSIKRYNFADFMALDEATIRNLDLFNRYHNGEYSGSLLSIIDQTVTNMGGRMLRRSLLLPLLDAEKIDERLNAVKELKADHLLIKDLINQLKQIADMERLLGRIGCNRATARDMVALKNSLQLIPRIKELLNNKTSELIKKIIDNIDNHKNLVELLETIFVDDPAHTTTEGNMIRDGYNANLDELHQISRGGKEWLLAYQEKEIERTGISSLKVRFNSVFGYYIEVSKTNLAQVPPDYYRKQTLVNAERFITPTLKEHEDKIVGAEEKINNLEYQIFLETVEKVQSYFSSIQKTAENIALLDMLLGFAILANTNNYCQPIINNEGIIKIKNGRHPVIEVFQKEKYVPNDLEMDHDKNEFILLTGPNMSGKSSYLRQSALIPLLAQIGSFVPAEEATIGVIDRIFTRVGASDNLAEGVSTFMAEMQEAANILNNATNKSLIILDELGRGTSTYDGVSIAEAIMEYIHNNLKAKTIFATHYHELTAEVEKMARGVNYCVAVSEDNGQVVFLHKIVKGASSESYGIEVAKLAGLPKVLTDRAYEILALLESRQVINVKDKSLQNTLPLVNKKEKEVIKSLQNIDINGITPLDALKKISALKDELNNEEN